MGQLRRVIVNEWMSFDGVVQSAGADDDSADGYADAGGFLFGRRTFELLATYWPNAGEEEQAVARPLNQLPKYVASTTLSDPLEWENATVLRGDAAKAVDELRHEEGGDLHVIGSTQLVHTLLEHDLVDGYRLMIDPVVVGGGKRVFTDDGVLRALRLIESKVTTTGAVLATYTSG